MLSIIIYNPLKRFMHAMFRPCLSNCFQFNVSRFSTQCDKIFLDSPHLLNSQIHLPTFTDFQKLFIICIQNIKFLPVEDFIYCFISALIKQTIFVYENILYYLVSKYFVCDSLELISRKLTGYQKSFCSLYRSRTQT